MGWSNWISPSKGGKMKGFLNNFSVWVGFTIVELCPPGKVEKEFNIKRNIDPAGKEFTR